jgi:hypothetical protein
MEENSSPSESIVSSEEVPYAFNGLRVAQTTRLDDPFDPSGGGEVGREHGRGGSGQRDDRVEGDESPGGEALTYMEFLEDRDGKQAVGGDIRVGELTLDGGL